MKALLALGLALPLALAVLGCSARSTATMTPPTPTPTATPSPTPTPTPTPAPVPAVDVVKAVYAAIGKKDMPTLFSHICSELLPDALSWFGPLLDEWYEVQTMLVGINDMGETGGRAMFDVHYIVGDGYTQQGATDRVLLRMEDRAWCVTSMYRVRR